MTGGLVSAVAIPIVAQRASASSIIRRAPQNKASKPLQFTIREFMPPSRYCTCRDQGGLAFKLGCENWLGSVLSATVSVKTGCNASALSLQPYFVCLPPDAGFPHLSPKTALVPAETSQCRGIKAAQNGEKSLPPMEDVSLLRRFINVSRISISG